MMEITFTIDIIHKIDLLRIYIYMYIKYKNTFVVSNNTLIPMNTCEIQSMLVGCKKINDLKSKKKNEPHSR